MRYQPQIDLQQLGQAVRHLSARRAHQARRDSTSRQNHHSLTVAELTQLGWRRHRPGKSVKMPLNAWKRQLVLDSSG